MKPWGEATCWGKYWRGCILMGYIHLGIFGYQLSNSAVHSIKFSNCFASAPLTQCARHSVVVGFFFGIVPHNAENWIVHEHDTDVTVDRRRTCNKKKLKCKMSVYKISFKQSQKQIEAKPIWKSVYQRKETEKKYCLLFWKNFNFKNIRPWSSLISQIIIWLKLFWIVSRIWDNWNNS